MNKCNSDYIIGVILIMSTLFYIATNTASFIEYDTLWNKLNHIDSTLSAKPIASYDTINVTVTTYSPTIAQCDSNPTLTASGYKITSKYNENVVAISRDLMNWNLNFNDTIEIKGTGYDGKYIVKDLMHSRWNKRVDICIPHYGQDDMWKNCKIIIKK